MKAPSPSFVFNSPIFSLLIFTLLSIASADEIRGKGLLLEPRLSVGEDYQLGFRSGYAVRSWDGRTASLFLDAETRMFPQGVRVRSSPSFEYQYQELRWSVGPGFSAGLSLNESITVSAAAGLVYTDGYYWGSNSNPRSGWLGWLETGLQYKLTDHSYAGVSLQYRPLPGIFPGRIQLAYGFLFGKGLLP